MKGCPLDLQSALFRFKLSRATASGIEMLDAYNSGWIDFGAQGIEHIEHMDGNVALEDATRLQVSRSQ